MATVRLRQEHAHQGQRQIAFGTYLWDDAAGAYIPGGLDVLALLGERVAEIVAFLDADLTRSGWPARAGCPTWHSVMTRAIVGSAA
jgi:hypothetical protein